jgi:hypothetical protein
VAFDFFFLSLGLSFFRLRESGFFSREREREGEGVFFSGSFFSLFEFTSNG